MLRLVRPLDPGPLGLARIGIGLAALCRAFIALPVLLRLADDDVIRAPVFTWMPEPSTTMAWVVVSLWVVSSVLVVLGYSLPISGTLLVACLVWMLTFDLQTYSNHVYLMAWLVLLLVVADAGVARSIKPASRPVASWTLALIMLQTSIVYGFSAVTKLNDEFLTGEVLAGVLRGGVVPFPEALRTPEVLGPLAVMTVLVEAFLAFGLWIPRLRRIAYVLGIGLHAAIPLLMPDTLELLVFSVLMLSTYPLFAQFDPQPTTSAGEVVKPATA
jgi:hypothetical protein